MGVPNCSTFLESGPSEVFEVVAEHFQTEKVANFSYMRSTAFLPQARKTLCPCSLFSNMLLLFAAAPNSGKSEERHWDCIKEVIRDSGG